MAIKPAVQISDRNLVVKSRTILTGVPDKVIASSKPQPLLRLTGIKKISKFQTKDDPGVGIKSIVNIAKEKHGLKYVFIRHAITGYWGGVRPGMKEMQEYDSAMKYPALSKRGGGRK